MATDYELIHGQLHVTNSPSKPEALGRGAATIRGATYLQGPVQMGNDSSFGSVEATVMVGPLTNSDSKSADTTLMIKGDTQIKEGVLKDSIAKNCSFTGGTISGSTGTNCNFQNSTINVQSWKGFDIPHPKKENHRLRYVCLEGPEGGVYIRGRIQNQTEITLPDYWENLVDTQSITISLTPVGSHQDIIVKRWDSKKVYLQSKGGIPINCFYHIFAERIDGEKLIVEYEGSSPSDYPGDSSQFSIAGHDY